VRRFVPGGNRGIVATGDERDHAVEPRTTSLHDGADLTMLRLALDSLPGDQRAAIRMAVVERLTLPEIASRLGSSQADVREAMRDGLFALRDVLGVIDPAVSA
jgi:DNA-directed RNA polymerase specialized sigma24 family protein